MSIQYGTGSVGDQIVEEKFIRKALIEARGKIFFSDLSPVRMQPKNTGKKMKQHHYLPVLDDRNINDQGLDAEGASIAREVTIQFNPNGEDEAGVSYLSYFAVGNGASDAAALTDAEAKAEAILTAIDLWAGDYAGTKAALEADGWVVTAHEGVPKSGNFMGSSKDIGAISNALPALREEGGKVNRVGMTRVDIESNLVKRGFYTDFTDDLLNFDDDAQMYEHIMRLLMDTAYELNEYSIQIDLINNAGIIKYGGEATNNATMTGEAGEVPSVISYEDIMRGGIDLDDNLTPRDTTMVKGSTLTDTVTIRSARICYIGSELTPMLMAMKNLHDKPALTEAHKYADATKLLNSELGSIDSFRFVVVPDMVHWSGVGADVANNDGYRETNGKYDVFPMLVVGNESFATISFKSRKGGKSKFTVIAKKPGKEIADMQNPYGSEGFISIQWFYGYFNLRPERILVMKTVAKY